METALIPLRSNPRRSNARTVTRSARVESRPPESPTTAVLAWICSSLVFSPFACIAKMASQRCERFPLFSGTKGKAGNFLVRLSSLTGNSKNILQLQSSVSGWRQVVVRLRSWASFCKSISAKIKPVENCWDSASREPSVSYTHLTDNNRLINWKWMLSSCIQ